MKERTRQELILADMRHGREVAARRLKSYHLHCLCNNIEMLAEPDAGIRAKIAALENDGVILNILSIRVICDQRLGFRRKDAKASDTAKREHRANIMFVLKEFDNKNFEGVRIELYIIMSKLKMTQSVRETFRN